MIMRYEPLGGFGASFAVGAFTAMFFGSHSDDMSQVLPICVSSRSPVWLYSTKKPRMEMLCQISPDLCKLLRLQWII